MPSAEISKMRLASNHERSRSCLAPGARAEIPRRESTTVASTFLIARDIVHEHRCGRRRPPGALFLPAKRRARRLPRPPWRRRTRFRPPLGDHASPPSACQPRDKASLPAVHVQNGHGVVADLVVMLEKRDLVALAAKRAATAARGRRFRSARFRSDTRSDSCRPRCATRPDVAPSGDQSASFTFSRISRGAPPDNGTRASVPAVPLVVGPSRIAISPVELIARMRPSGRSDAAGTRGCRDAWKRCWSARWPTAR